MVICTKMLLFPGRWHLGCTKAPRRRQPRQPRSAASASAPRGPRLSLLEKITSETFSEKKSYLFISNLSQSKAKAWWLKVAIVVIAEVVEHQTMDLKVLGSYPGEYLFFILPSYILLNSNHSFKLGCNSLSKHTLGPEENPSKM